MTRSFIISSNNIDLLLCCGRGHNNVFYRISDRSFTENVELGNLLDVFIWQ